MARQRIGPRLGGSVEDHRAVAVDEDALFQHETQGSREHGLLDVAAGVHILRCQVVQTFVIAKDQCQW